MTHNEKWSNVEFASFHTSNILYGLIELFFVVPTFDIQYL
jgi:hypothetical protein